MSLNVELPTCMDVVCERTRPARVPNGGDPTARRRLALGREDKPGALAPPELLMLAVLDEAVTTYRRSLDSRDPEARRAGSEAYRWVLSDDREWPFSFENICESLRLDPDYIRLGLKRMRIRALKRLRDRA